MVKPAPISLRLRAHEITSHAYQVLTRLNEQDRQRRRVRHLAARALVYVVQMQTEVRSMSAADRDQFELNCKLARSVLRRISKPGV
jgi:hypothetical protein